MHVRVNLCGAAASSKRISDGTAAHNAPCNMMMEPFWSRPKDLLTNNDLTVFAGHQMTIAADAEVQIHQQEF
jgi:hypothetical protein